jgi:hypothetical protein
MLKRYWAQLCREYDVNYPLFIVDEKDHFDVRFNWTMSVCDFPIQTESFVHLLEDGIKRSIDTELNNGSIMTTNLTPTKSGIVLGVFIIYQALMYILQTTTASVEFIEYYLRQSLKHEMGHCISNSKISINDATTVKRIQDEYMRYIDIAFPDDPWMWQLGYYNSPQELNANNEVGLTAEDMVGLDKILDSYHI